MICTSRMMHINELNRSSLNNKEEDRVKIIYYPIYL